MSTFTGNIMIGKESIPTKGHENEGAAEREKFVKKFYGSKGVQTEGKELKDLDLPVGSLPPVGQMVRCIDKYDDGKNEKDGWETYRVYTAEGFTVTFAKLSKFGIGKQSATPTINVNGVAMPQAPVLATATSPERKGYDLLTFKDFGIKWTSKDLENGLLFLSYCGDLVNTNSSGEAYTIPQIGMYRKQVARAARTANAANSEAAAN